MAESWTNKIRAAGHVNDPNALGGVGGIVAVFAGEGFLRPGDDQLPGFRPQLDQTDGRAISTASTH
jgi:hypothetical protein